MNVIELINELKKLPPTKEVVMLAPNFENIKAPIQYINADITFLDQLDDKVIIT